MNNIHNDNIQNLKDIYAKTSKIKISNFLNEYFAEELFKYAVLEKNWNLATGIDNQKYEKQDNIQNDKINNLQIKNVNAAFGKDHFTYIFYRTMNNGKNMSYFEFTLRKILNSSEFLTMLNEITDLGLTKLTTMFMSKYKAGNFLSPHTDKGNGRMAFVINLTKFWKPQYGGNLHFMNDERTEIIDTFVPEFNNLILFYVPEENGISHYVSHVEQSVKKYALLLLDGLSKSIEDI